MLTLVYGIPGAGGVATTYMAGVALGHAVALTGVSVLLLILKVGTNLLSSRLITTPYGNTVVRM